MPFGRHYSPLEEKAAKLLILPLPQKVDSRENFNGEMQKILIFWVYTLILKLISMCSNMEEEVLIEARA